MARGLNKAMLIGHLGQDPEVKTLQNGTAVCNLSLATTEKWKDKNSGEMKELTEWHRVSIFGKLAEIAGQYCRKGSQIYIEGKLRTRKWQDKNGADRYTTEIVADELQLLGSKGGDGGAKAAPAAKAGPQPGDEDFNDDIPF